MARGNPHLAARRGDVEKLECRIGPTRSVESLAVVVERRALTPDDPNVRRRKPRNAEKVGGGPRLDATPASTVVVNDRAFHADGPHVAWTAAPHGAKIVGW